MGFFDDLSCAVENTAKQVSKKVSEFADTSKKAVEDAALRERLSREYEKLGRLVADSAILSTTAKHSGEEFTKVFDKISEYNERIEKNNKKIKKCSCGKSINNVVLYCPYCGKKAD